MPNKDGGKGAGEMVHWLRTHTALVEDPSLDSRVHVGWLTTTCSYSSGDAHHTHTHTL